MRRVVDEEVFARWQVERAAAGVSGRQPFRGRLREPILGGAAP